MAAAKISSPCGVIRKFGSVITPVSFLPDVVGTGVKPLMDDAVFELLVKPDVGKRVAPLGASKVHRAILLRVAEGAEYSC